MKQIFNWIMSFMSDVVFTSSYGPVLGMGIQKDPPSNAALGKIREHGSAHGVNIAVYATIYVDILSRKKNTQYLNLCSDLKS